MSADPLSLPQPFEATVPLEMLEAPRWICWRDDKVPSSAKTGKDINAFNQANWRTVAEARKAARSLSLGGVGFVVGDGFVCVDLDHCRTAATGELQPWAREVLAVLDDSYVEVSPSGEGLHIWLWATGGDLGGFSGIKTQHMDADGYAKIEVFTAGKWATVTGERLADAPRSLAPAGARLAELRRRFFVERPASSADPAPARLPVDRADKGRHWVEWYLAHPEGGRNDTGHRLALQLRDDARLSLAEAEPYMLDYQRQCPAGDHPYTEVEALRTLRSVYSQSPREEARSLGRLAPVTPLRPRAAAAPVDGSTSDTPTATSEGGASPHLTDMGNAERLAGRCGDRLRYVAKWKRWVVWDGQRWAQDDTGVALQLAKETVRAIYQEAADTAEDAERAALVKHAVKSESERSLRAMLALAEPELAIRPDDLDTDPWLFNVQNGTLDLRTCELRPHNPLNYLTRLAPVTYDERATAPTWDAFLSRIFADDNDLMRFLQRAAGYSLTGLTREHALFICYGSGRNGKSTFLETLQALMADHATQAPATTFTTRGPNPNPDAPRNDLAALKGARLVTAVETAEGARLDESLIKQATGGDKITARFLHGEYFSFQPAFKLWLATNHKPSIRGTDEGIWSRVRLLPFNVTIPESEQDQELPDKLRAELPGILNWALVGCALWQRHKLGVAEAVTQATGAYRAEQDLLATFLSDRCVTVAHARITVKELYSAYVEWAEEAGERPLPKRQFNQRLQERGFRNEPGHANLLYWQRIGLRYQHETTT